MGRTFIKYKLATLLNINRIITIWYLELTPTFLFSGETHDFWEMVYVDKGTAVATTKKGEFTLKAGEVVFYKPNEFHALKSAEGEAPNVFIITFDCDSPAMRYFRGFRSRLPDKLKPLIREIIKESNATFKQPFIDPVSKKPILLEDPILGGQQLIRNYLQILLIHMMREDNDNKVFANQRMLNDHLSHNVVSYLEEHKYDDVNIDAVCNHFNYSKTYLCTAFKQSTGMSIMQYYNKIRMEEAKSLLRLGTLSITQISERLCFCNPHYFSCAFQKYVHMSPTEYQKSVNPY